MFSAWFQGLWTLPGNLSRTRKASLSTKKATGASVKGPAWVLLPFAACLRLVRLVGKSQEDNLSSGGVLAISVKNLDAQDSKSITIRIQPASKFNQRRANVQQLTCKMVWSFSFYSLLFSFLIFELKQQ